MIDRIDDVVGAALERTVQRHHRSRLTKLGHRAVLGAPADAELWVPGQRPPRSGNDIRVLIDGEEALTAISDARLAAKRCIHIAGWHLTLEFRLAGNMEPPPCVTFSPSCPTGSTFGCCYGPSPSCPRSGRPDP